MNRTSVWSMSRKLHLPLGASVMVCSSLVLAKWADRGSRTVDLNCRPLLKVDSDSFLSPML
jgi:hypothetical protein